MAAVTTTFAGAKLKKPFAWSYSKLKNFETCPKRHWHIDIQKDVREEESESLTWGNYVHKSLAQRISSNKPLTPDIIDLEKWALRLLNTPGHILVEQKLAITTEFSPCGFFDGNAWFRTVGDVIKINGSVGLVADWKTGKILEDSCQLALAAACVFAHYPEVMVVRSKFIWLKQDAETTEDFRREDMPSFWKSVWPRIAALKQAAETNNYPPKPGGLCRRWCPVRQCPHYGEGR